ncbi:hypothetical protein HMI56_005044 [Coelomomyces lativittatus]|nr:hypothetical protein HMI56_005044 [Coelomomyces lativittatus]
MTTMFVFKKEFLMGFLMGFLGGLCSLLFLIRWCLFTKKKYTLHQKESWHKRIPLTSTPLRTETEQSPSTYHATPPSSYLNFWKEEEGGWLLRWVRRLFHEIFVIFTKGKHIVLNLMFMSSLLPTKKKRKWKKSFEEETSHLLPKSTPTTHTPSSSTSSSLPLSFSLLLTFLQSYYETLQPSSSFLSHVSPGSTPSIPSLFNLHDPLEGRYQDGVGFCMNLIGMHWMNFVRTHSSSFVDVLESQWIPKLLASTTLPPFLVL